MNILVIGSGGREHSIAECFAKSKQVKRVIVAPGNAGIALKYECANLQTQEEIFNFCAQNLIDLVFVGPEKPIADGLADYLKEKGVAVIAPVKFAAQLESSKIFAKNLMQEKGIPTAEYRIAKTIPQALEQINYFGFPTVIKTDGLAGGKGVFVVKNRAEAQEALKKIHFSEKGVIVEEFLRGWEVSLFAITDGWEFQTTIFAQDHKQLYAGDQGPNTGGMGSYAPVPEAEKYRNQIEAEIIHPVLSAMRESGNLYKGILYCGLMITKEGPKVMEFNCRLGDPEAQVVLPLLETDFVEICQAILQGEINLVELKFSNKTALAVVLASEGYPFAYKKGFPLSLPANLSGIYFSGVEKGKKGLVTSGGRVLCAVGIGKDLTEAREKAYSIVQQIIFENKIFRQDIGLRKNTFYDNGDS
ncbi:MAG TPA: phosphoribosylamine--glycine ligase [Candidatus Cloacimonas sp.]|nr:phosphoribosylamine--glycine ligase [Candidatus Cloacimonas sp.]